MSPTQILKWACHFKAMSVAGTPICHPTKKQYSLATPSNILSHLVSRQRKTPNESFLPQSVVEMLTTPSLNMNDKTSPIEFADTHTLRETPAQKRLFEEQMSETVIPMATTTHNNSQLRYGRRSAKHPSISVPLCIKGNDCTAQTIEYNDGNGPLPRYLSKEDERIFQEEGCYPITSTKCWCCLIADVLNAVIYTRSFSAKQQMGRASLITPPFQHPVNIEGGYKFQCMAVTTEVGSAIPTNIVNPQHGRAVIDPKTGEVYIDMSYAEYGTQLKRSLNSQAAI